MRYYYIPTRWLKLKRLLHSLPTFGVADHNFHILFYDGTITFEKALPISYTITHILSYDPEILLLRIQLRGMQVYVYKKTCT